jgi:L-lactate dehydrogenase complex protein LldE
MRCIVACDWPHKTTTYMDDLQQNLESRVRIGLFVTCLVDMFRPNAGFAAAKLLEQAGYEVFVPEQGCCGQANFNGGDSTGAMQMATQVIRTFSEFDFVVVPSASCAAMLKAQYPELCKDDTELCSAAKELAAKTWELTSFLHEVAGLSDLSAEFNGNVVVHDACTGLRELGIRVQPRALLKQVSGLSELPLQNPDVCCGFGGLFCVKYPDISARIADKKLADIQALDKPVDALVSTDLGCLLHLSGKLHRDGSSVPAFHVAEVLAGMAEVDGTHSSDDD